MDVEEKDRVRNKENPSDSSISGKDADIDSDPTVLLSERIENLKQAIDEIDSALAQRKELSGRFLDQIKEEKNEVKRQLDYLNPPWKTGFYPELEFLRLSFHNSLTSRSKDSRTEELKYWQDVINLIIDRRKLVDEYKELLAARKRLMQP